LTSVRRNPITGEPVIFAPERATRPNALAGGRAIPPLPTGTIARPPSCPFCPGFEHETPPEIARVSERQVSEGRPWLVRVFPNKYPSSRWHEVIVESPHHDATFGGLDHPASVVAMYAERHRDLAAREGVRSVVLFKNHGAMGGASLEHIHSQLVGLEFIPPRVAREQQAFAAACPLCETIHRELVIEESEHFVRLAPYCSSFAFEQWIVPRRHAASFGSITNRESDDLAAALSVAARSLERISAAYNWMVMSFDGPAHWYIQAVPRLTTIAGFELATSTFIDIIDPAAAARQLR
jgi:UDPglucose--hexose-1-phosphate uridylyltransferase